MTPRPTLAIMGIRGVPAQHGGFETFAERLAPFLVQNGWRVTVYCQEDDHELLRESTWQGVRRVHIGVGPDTAWNSIRFDWACVKHAAAERPPLVLTLGYNTAVFGLRLRAAGVANVINMDGIEWSRSKWGRLARSWLYLNERAGCLVGTHLLADHPEIARHLATRVAADKITMIPYGADLVAEADAALLAPLDLEPGRYATLIARSEPENSVFEIVSAFSARRRGIKLVVLGHYLPHKLPFHAKVLAAASDEVVFPGAIYDAAVVRSLRRHGLLYVHGHRVGGTNPSLLEAMGAGNAVLAHDNRFNRWVAGDGAVYFSDIAGCTRAFDALLGADAVSAARRAKLAQANRRRISESFTWHDVLTQYESVLARLHARVKRRLPAASAVGADAGTAAPRRPAPQRAANTDFDPHS